MTSRKLAALVAGLTFAAFAIGCSNDNNNNANNANNSNRAANANANVTNTNVNTNTTANTNKAPTREDVEKNKDKYGQEAKASGRKVGTGASDLWLWTKAKYDLAAANDLRDSTINVDVENGVITLTGNVANNDQVKKADTIAKAVDGQKGVKNMLKVSATGSSNANANTKNANTAKH